MSLKFPILCLMGPTASGKTELAVQLVRQFSCDIISVDSAMVYRGMDIGTAKPGPDILKIAPHRLINIRDPADPYSVGQFREDAFREIADIIANKKIPLLVGGTMLYFRALQEGLSELPAANSDVRAMLVARGEEQGWPAMHERLTKIDPVAGRRIHPHDSQRIQRALEVFELSGKSLSDWQRENTLGINSGVMFPEHEIINLALAPGRRAILHERIAARFHKMLGEGFVDEVRILFNRGDLSLSTPAIRSVGYRQVWEYLLGNMTYDEMQEKAVIATRQLAKRQLTWLRSWPNVSWFDSEAGDLVGLVFSFMDKIISNSKLGSI